MTPLTLVAGASARDREAAIAHAMTSVLELAPDATQPVVAIVEGALPAGAALSALEQAFGPHRLHVIRLAPGCPCCQGNLPLRVHLNRILRAKPAHIYLALANTEHLSSLRAWLHAPPYDQHLTLTDPLNLANTASPMR